MEKGQTNKNGTLGTFTNGVINGAVNGALMLGIFAGLMLGASSLGILAGGYSVATAVSTIAIGTLATAIFGGIASVRKESKEARNAERDARNTRLSEPEIERGASVTIPALSVEHVQGGALGMADHATQQDKVANWRDRVGASRAADASFAKAIEEERAHSENQAASLA